MIVRSQLLFPTLGQKMKNLMIGLVSSLACLTCGLTSLSASENDINFVGGLSSGLSVSVPFVGIRADYGPLIYEANISYKSLSRTHFGSLNLSVMHSVIESDISRLYYGLGIQTDIYLYKGHWSDSHSYIYPEVIVGHEKSLASGHKIFMQVHWHPVEGDLDHGIEWHKEHSFLLRIGLSI